MIAVLSVPAPLAALVGRHLDIGDGIRSKHVPDVWRTYFLTPLSMLAGLDLTHQPAIELAYFETYEEAVEWAEADVERRRRLGLDPRFAWLREILEMRR